MLWGVIVMVLTQILGYLPSLDFLDAKTLKLISFAAATALTCAKGVEMYFQKSEEIATHDEGIKGEACNGP